MRYEKHERPFLRLHDPWYYGIAVFIAQNYCGLRALVTEMCASSLAVLKMEKCFLGKNEAALLSGKLLRRAVLSPLCALSSYLR